jgi:hypothetical protein
LHLVRLAAPANRFIRAAISPPNRPNFDADSDEVAASGLAGVSSRQGCIVMRNAYSPLNDQNRPVHSSPHRDGDDTGWDNDIDNELVSLLEENARLRALVVRLSDLVLKNVVDQK